jgi:hypothetical protein
MHPTNTLHIDQNLLDIIQERLQSGKLPCAVAFDIAQKNNSSMQSIGQIVNAENIRFSKCQLGLFGYSPKNKIIKPIDSVEPELERAINDTKKDNVIQCAQIWKISKKLGMKKLHVSCACETLKLKIKGCQLGAF